MSEFQKRYDKLNPSQREAVDAIDGPVMVVAGPGTGKTELLSVRVANILQKTDALPSNILCLTFTDSGATAMRKRLSGLLGTDAYKIAIHTFHSFGSEVINQNGEYFYSGAHFRPADEISHYEILNKIFEKLPHSNPLASTMNGEFTYFSNVKTSISELKRGGLTPDELEAILNKNDDFINWINPKVQDVFSAKISKQILPKVSELASEIGKYSEKPLQLVGYMPLHELIGQSLSHAAEAAETDNSTKPITTWKKLYLEKNAHDEPVLKDEKRSRKLHALAKIYEQYLLAMQERELYDYDDMILRVIHAMEIFPELRYNLQENYQYILVDEFQDTNNAQMRLVWNLTNNPASEGRPNIMVVGDDDQAIYRFQGAELSNILDFQTHYQGVKVVTLTDNYRSQAEILTLARAVIVQGSERLENTIRGIDKTLTPHHKAEQPLLYASSYGNIAQSHSALADQIATDISTNPEYSRAVIARNHKQLVKLLPHLEKAGVPVRYERNENVLDTEPVEQLEVVAQAVHALSHDEFSEADAAIARLLAHPAWDINARDVWQLGLDAKSSRKTWLEIILTARPGTRLEQIGEWLVVTAQASKNQPLEPMLDTLFGNNRIQQAETAQAESEPFGTDLSADDFISPLYSYFFQRNSLNTSPSLYLNYLSALQAIRTRLRDYRPEEHLKLCDFVSFLETHRSLGLVIQARSEIETGKNAVELISAHKAKGLEYDTVYIVDAEESVWGRGAQSRGRMLQFTSNLPLSPAGDSDDERLRLLYVALTRAKNQLFLVSARESDNGKVLQNVGQLNGLLDFVDQPAMNIASAIEAQQTAWYTPLLSLPTSELSRLLAPTLERYKLSPTHLTNFLDISNGGPEMFLLNNLLRFPQSMSPSAAFGSAMHATLQRAHQHLSATQNRRPNEDILHDFEKSLSEFDLSETDHAKLLERGYEVLTAFLDQRYDSFTPSQIVERTFGGGHVVVGEAALTGIIDLIDIDHDEKTIFITDYKTGKAVPSWSGRNDYEKIKMHHYEQQLMFYKLLIDNSGKFSGYTVTGGRIEFVEPDPRGKVVLLDYSYDAKKLSEFTSLVNSVWRQIQSLSFTAPKYHKADYKSILEFEGYLLNVVNT